VVVVALLAGLLGTGTETASTATTKATLKVVKLKPFTVRGTGFKSRERVTLTLSAGKQRVRGTATATGRLTVTFPRAKVTVCTPYTLRAIGTAGTRVTVKRVVRAAACKPTATVTFPVGSVVIVGARFKPGERVTVNLVVDGEPHRRSGRASSTGVFKIDFGALPMNHCSAYSLTVLGSLGSRFATSRDALPC
jgi:hypothetical protein